jgi:aminopeptidase-like protein
MILDEYYNLAKKILFPINRSITGKGTKESLEIIKKQIPGFKIYKIKSRTKVFDWKIPPEWSLYDAYVLDKNKKKIINFKENNLHIVGYSQPINKLINKKELLKHTYSLPKKKNAIPIVNFSISKILGALRAPADSDEKEIKTQVI